MKTALVVDDTEIHRSATRTFLAMMGYRVEIAEDGIQALKKLDEAQFDVIFSDIEMPNMNGMELLKRIRKHGSAAKTPVVMLSTLDSEEMKSKLQTLGANYYLVKPFSADRIKAALQSVGM